MHFSQGGALLALGYFIAPLQGFIKKASQAGTVTHGFSVGKTGGLLIVTHVHTGNDRDRHGGGHGTRLGKKISCLFRVSWVKLLTSKRMDYVF